MEYDYSKGVIKLPNMELSILDRLVLEFVSKIKVKYVIVSGYVAILFGRGRTTEDVDIFIEKLDKKRFEVFYNDIVKSEKFYCINAEDALEAYNLLAEENGSVRFAEKGTFDPNFEIKFPTNKKHHYSLDNALTVDLGRGNSIRIGPLELQLAYKLQLGSDKDYEDAAHLYMVFESDLDKKKLKGFITELGIKRGIVKKVLGIEV